MCRDTDENGMHRQVNWMVPADTSILHFLESSQTPQGNYSYQTPKTIALNTGYSNRHIANRCRELADHAVIEAGERSSYRLGGVGEALLQGDLSPDKLEE